jgi:rare lipoprotein A (peptidoglycan hydrolase)
MRSVLAALLLCLACCRSSPATEITVGLASVDDGKPTQYDAANFTGKLSDGSKFTDGMRVAHRDLPIGSCVEVSKIGRDTNVHLAKVDDRGPCATPACQRNAPHLAKRLIDLKPKLASAMGCDGLCLVAYWPAPCSSTTP